MSYVNIENHGPVRHVILNRPERLNAISGALMDDLHAALRLAQAEEAVQVIVLSGNGRAFCAGDDLKEFGDQTRDADAIVQHIDRIQQITRDLMFGAKPVIGAVHGYAVGGGFEWLLNCDMVVAADDLVCFFPEMDWGQFVTGGVTHLLPQVVGYQKAMELWLLGERQSAADLKALGIVNWVVPKQQMLAKALEVGAKVATKSTFSVGRLKRLLTTQLNPQLPAALELEKDATIAAFGRPEAAERVRKFGQK
ncbi:enoyl-CoA hydratase [Rhodoferax koreense]|uniref:Enoyl-CoA hydratase n=1 Tax=Rhodoferax koreensis TaxID=1842727 RepID=A0A1P8JUA8_9BURK|nr:enoyl-CoA hydratase/isomerase family protein [Rhodoferax koreense]APW37315.1 enoyl-CoA hydratase [Rhodoferax koreense]